MTERCCDRGCETKKQMRAAHGDPQQFWEALLDAQSDGFITMAEAEATLDQYKRNYDAAPEK